MKIPAHDVVAIKIIAILPVFTVRNEIVPAWERVRVVLEDGSEFKWASASPGRGVEHEPAVGDFFVKDDLLDFDFILPAARVAEFQT